MTLIEILVALIVGTLVSLLAFTFYRNFMARMDRQKQVTSLQDGVRNAVDCINRYLIAGGVSGDSLFFDPHRLLSAPIVNGGHRVFDLKPDSLAIRVYGNYSGSAALLAAPVLNTHQRQVKVDNASLFKTGGFAYINAGSAQEVAAVSGIQDSILFLKDDLFATYPKMTLIFPLERITISLPDNKTLRVAREAADGSAVFVRSFVPTHLPGDSLEFRVRSVDREAGQIAYALTFVALTGPPTHALLARKSEQTVFVRGF